MPYLTSCFAILLATAGAASAQVPGAGTVTGTIWDPQGAVVRGATLTLTEPATGAQQHRESNDAGQYLFAGVLPGTYDLRVEAPGFQRAVATALKVEAGTGIVQDFHLTLGSVDTTVEVAASGERPLERADATLGSVMRIDMIKRLPNLTRDAGQLLSLQPGVTPLGEVTGSRRDQSTFILDGMDVTENYSGSGTTPFRAVIPLPTESIEEFRAVVANPNASFIRGSGAQVVVHTRRGTNVLHGSTYWYHRNDALNANTWDANRRGEPTRAERDHRFGFTAGAPIRRDRTFFFGHYEGRRRTEPVRVTRVVPTESLRQGRLRFLDGAGIVRTIDPRDFDPRGLGASAAILQLLQQYPTGNDAGGDGLNTTGLTLVLPAPTDEDFGVLRVDHAASDRWLLDGTARLSRGIQTSGAQVDLVNRALLSRQVTRPHHVSGAATAILSSRMTNRFQVGWTRDDFEDERRPPRAISPFNVALDFGPLHELVDVEAFRASGQGVTADYYTVSDHLHWQRSSHQIQSGFTLRHVDASSFREDRTAGALTTPIAVLSAGQSNVLTPDQRPAFLRPIDESAYSSLYSVLLGIVESVSMSAALDGSLGPLPPGTRLSTAHSMRASDFYLQDTWRVRPSLTVNLGLAYSWQAAPTERDGRQMIPVYAENGEAVLPQRYLQRKLEAARAGRTFNPVLAFQPVSNANRRTVFDADRGNWSPRASAAWSPSFTTGLLGAVLGPGRSVVRGGYGLFFDRTNLVTVTLVPSLSVGFSQSVQLDPRNSAGQNHRVIVDGPVPIPSVRAVTTPVIPQDELISVALDPGLRTPRHHVVDATVQRELPGGLVLELAYVGRMGRGLYQTVNLNNSPYMFLDPVSGQTFAQAFDALAAELRSGIAPNAVTLQPWFENIRAGGTRFLASTRRGDFVAGNLNNLFWFGLDPLVTQPFNNRQVRDLFFSTSLGRSNYHAGMLTLTKRTSHGLHFNVSYTLSRSRDQVGIPQALPQRVPNSFFPDTDYGPSVFDRRHLVSSSWVYDLPLGAGNGWISRVFGGWYVSGVYTASSGIPLGVAQSNQAYGGGLGGVGFSIATAAIPIERVDYPNQAHRSLGSGGVGVNAAAGAGLNYFADPQAAFRNFRHVRLDSDQRSGRGMLRGFPSWNVDIAVGKTTRAGGRMRAGISVEFFNVFNHVVFANPSLSLTQPANFGVVMAQENFPRRIQAGLRLDW